MNFRSLQYFITIAEELNLHRAAERLHIAQPALTRQIRVLEQELNVILFRREARGLKLTASGQSFLADARLMVSFARQARERAALVESGELGTVRLGFHEVAHRYTVFRNAIASFIEQNSNIHFQFRIVSSQQQIELLRSGELDAGFVFLWEPLPSHLSSRRIRRESYALAMHPKHRLASQETLDARDIAEEAFIWVDRSRNRAQSDALIKMCTGCGFVPRIVHEGLTSEAAMLSLVAAGAGVAFLPLSARDTTTAVALKSISGMSLEVELHLTWPLSNQTAAAERFISGMVELLPIES